MLNVAIIVPTAKSGGAEKQSICLMQALMESCNVFYCVLYDLEGRDVDWKCYNLNDNCHIIKLKDGNALNKYRQLSTVIEALKVDAIFSYLTKPDFFAALIGRKLGIKNVFLGIRNETLPLWKVIMERFANCYARGIIINNYAGKRKFEGWGFKNMTVIPNCYVNFNPRPDRRPDHDFVRVITVGRFVPQKDYLTAIRAFAMALAEVPSLRYTIVGFGDMEQDIRRWVREQGVEDKVEILISPDNIIQLLQQSDIYLCASLFEGTSNSIMEAMDAYLPVIATNVGDNNILVKDGVSGAIVNCGDVDNMASKLVDFALNPTSRIIMGDEGNRILRDKYSFEKFKVSYLKLLEANFQTL